MRQEELALLIVQFAAAYPVGSLLLLARLRAARPALAAILLRRRHLRLALLLFGTTLLSDARADYRLHRHRFHINDLENDEEAIHYFRFSISALHELSARLQLPRYFSTRSGFPTDFEEALLIVLNRLTYPSRLRDQFNGRFQRSRSELSEI